MATIGLCMIVKNESRVIERCLESVRPLVQYVLVVDTGSDDGTQDVIRRYLERVGLPGEVVDEPWRDFAYNRSFALAALRKHEDVDYALIIDADDVLVPDAGFDAERFRAALREDMYDVRLVHGGASFHRPQICRNRLPFRYRAVLHEFLEAPPGALTRTTAEGFHMDTGRGGARGRNPRKYHDDAALLEKALSTETDPLLVSRYTFYLGQSYRDCDDPEQMPPALAAYLRRAELGHWIDEVFVSLLEAGKLMAKLGRPFDEVIATWQRASNLLPTRAEALHAASRHCRETGHNAEGFAFAERGLKIAPPTGGLFIEPWVYDYGLLDEYAVNGYWCGAYRECLDACLRLLSVETVPASMSARVLANARFAAERLPAAPSLGKLGAESPIAQHRLAPARNLRPRLHGIPRVLLAILAKQKQAELPLYLDCIEALDYPKSSIVLHVRTNNNTDRTEPILRSWLERVGRHYAAVEFDASDEPEPVQRFATHEWNPMRFRVLGRIRNASLRRATAHGCDFYFVADVDNFVRPCTLRELVALDLPIVAPLLRSIAPGAYYSNFHAEIDANGYYQECGQYHWILNRWVRGIVEVPVVHCTYLIRADVLDRLAYVDASERHEYVVFSDSARKADVVQYLDNRQVYGYITFGRSDGHHVEGGVEHARALLGIGAPEPPTRG